MGKIRRLLPEGLQVGDLCIRLDNVNVSSNKEVPGYLLGGAGSVGAIFTILAVKEGGLQPAIDLKDVHNRMVRNQSSA